MANFVQPPVWVGSSLRTIGTALAWACAVATLGVALQAQTFNVLYDFPWGSDGAHPVAGLVRDSAGNLYGTLVAGGNQVCFNGCGVVFSFNPDGVETVLYTFAGPPDGELPVAGLLRDNVGNLYGTTQNGGTNDCGTVYKVDINGNERVLHSFSGGAGGCIPIAGVIADSAGNLYGTTNGGGDSGCATGGCGLVYKLDASGTMTILHTFQGPEGAFPANGFLLRDASGNLYGVTVAGGQSCPWSLSGCGVVYRLGPSGKMVLYKFTGYADGHFPQGSLLRDSAGNFYGVTAGGGNMSCSYGSGCGVIFKFDPAGKMNVLYRFGGGDGDSPAAGLIEDAAGNLYGTTERGGEYQEGAVFTLRKSGQEIVLHSFTGDDDGYLPTGALVADPAGNIYGTSSNGGPPNGGALFEITR
jgi:uncharacterized repeat protein (TIGR03803 family)